MNFEVETKKLLLDLQELMGKLTAATDEEKREYCIQAHSILTTYNLRTWNNLYRELLPKRGGNVVVEAPEEDIEFELPPV